MKIQILLSLSLLTLISCQFPQFIGTWYPSPNPAYCCIPSSLTIITTPQGYNATYNFSPSDINNIYCSMMGFNSSNTAITKTVALTPSSNGLADLATNYSFQVTPTLLPSAYPSLLNVIAAFPDVGYGDSCNFPMLQSNLSNLSYFGMQNGLTGTWGGQASNIVTYVNGTTQLPNDTCCIPDSVLIGFDFTASLEVTFTFSQNASSNPWCQMVLIQPGTQLFDDLHIVSTIYWHGYSNPYFGFSVGNLSTNTSNLQVIFDLSAQLGSSDGPICAFSLPLLAPPASNVFLGTWGPDPLNPPADTCCAPSSLTFSNSDYGPTVSYDFTESALGSTACKTLDLNVLDLSNTTVYSTNSINMDSFNDPSHDFTFTSISTAPNTVVTQLLVQVGLCDYTYVQTTGSSNTPNTNNTANINSTNNTTDDTASIYVNALTGTWEVSQYTTMSILAVSTNSSLSNTTCCIPNTVQISSDSNSLQAPYIFIVSYIFPADITSNTWCQLGGIRNITASGNLTTIGGETTFWIDFVNNFGFSVGNLSDNASDIGVVFTPLSLGGMESEMCAFGMVRSSASNLMLSIFVLLSALSFMMV